MEYERDILATVEDLVVDVVENRCDNNVNNLGDGGDVNLDGGVYGRNIGVCDGGLLDEADDFVEERVRVVHPTRNGMGVKSNAVYSSVRNLVSDVAVDT